MMPCLTRFRRYVRLLGLYARSVAYFEVGEPPREMQGEPA